MTAWEMCQIQKAEVGEAIKLFPATFGLRAFPGRVFRIEPEASYWSELEGQPLLYAFVECDGKWLSFAKGTVAELRREMVKL